MNEIQNKLLYFKTKTKFEEALSNPGIAETSIAFIEDTRSIYTHGTYFNTSTSDISNVVGWYLYNYYTK